MGQLASRVGEVDKVELNVILSGDGEFQGAMMKMYVTKLLV
jgi:hypothetical protein